MILYPDITVRLTGEDGNVFSVIGKVRKELRRAGVPADKITEFVKEATSGDYDHAISTCMKWVDVS